MVSVLLETALTTWSIQACFYETWMCLSLDLLDLLCKKDSSSIIRTVLVVVWFLLPIERSQLTVPSSKYPINC